MIELRRSGITHEYIQQMPIEYENELLGYEDTRLILVDGRALLATLALRETDAAMAEQLKARMRRLDTKLGLLANFYGTRFVVTPVRIG